MIDLKQEILNATGGGLDVLVSLYPEARECVGTKKHFKMRPDEKTPSATISQKDGVWYVKDFGNEQHALNCFDAFMFVTGCTYKEALYQLADQYRIDYTLKADINKPKNIEFKDAQEGAKEGDFEYKMKDEPGKADLDCFGEFVKPQTLRKYNYYSLEYYRRTFKNSKTGRLTTVTITSSDDYPIFLHDMGNFKKVYIPLAFEKKDRFFYVGKVEKDYINGFAEAKKAYEALQEEYDDEGNEKGVVKEKKLDAIIICSGERDAMNVAGMGYYPIWFNSETAEITDLIMNRLRSIASAVYNVPDIDATGIRQGNKLALQYMDIYTIELPQWLGKYRDSRGRPRKDLRDFLELRPMNSEFKKLMQTAKRAQFWKIKYSEKGVKSEISTTSLLHYLKLNGFYKLKDRITGEMKPVRVEAYKVEEMTPKQIRDFIREDLKRRQVENTALEAYINSKKTTQSVYDDLDTIDLSFDISAPNSRTLFFDNCRVIVPAGTKDMLQIATTQAISDSKELQSFSWTQKLIPHKFTPLPASFHLNDDGVLEIDDTRSCCFRYLINASRIYWRKEYEELKSMDDQENYDYRQGCMFSIYGNRLTNDEKLEQMKHLLSKLWAIGFLLHHYKIDSRALCLWIMENKLTQEDESSGGSGKSFFMRMFHYLKVADIVTLDGRDSDLTKNNHFLDRVSTNTDILFVDDAEKAFNFNSFYGKITGVLTVNPKGTQSFEIDYKDSPYVVISSNFPPPSDERSTLRRLMPLVYSDYYHEQGDDNKYNETRKISDDFGRDLFDWRYTEEDYNADYNFLIDCLQFYLNNQDNIMRPPMENIIKRIQIKEMGDTFKDWALGYFSPDNGNLDRLLCKQEVYSDYLQYAGSGKFTKNPANFKRALQSFAKFKGYIFNPTDMRGYQPEAKRSTITTTINNKRAAYEFIYLQTEGTPLNNILDTDDEMTKEKYRQKQSVPTDPQTELFNKK